MAVFIDSTHRPLIRLKLVQHSNNPHNRAIPVYDADLSTEQDSDVEELSHTVKEEEDPKPWPWPLISMLRVFTHAWRVHASAVPFLVHFFFHR